MATSKTTIELNGKLYDARSGKVIGEGSAVPAATAAKRTNGAVLDGFVRPSASQKAHTQVKPPPKLSTKPIVARTTAKHVQTKLEKSNTLMRPAVQKPKPIAKSSIGATQKYTVIKKEDPARQARASTVSRSGQIQRFNPDVNHHIIKKEAPLAVATQANNSVAHSIAHLADPVETTLVHSVDATLASLRNASAHLQTFEGHVAQAGFWHRVGFKNKAANFATMAFAGLLLAGFFGYQNAPNIETRLAATRSGVSASLPSYSPAGFSASRGVKSEPGKVTITFTSNSSDKQFRVTQQASNWSSDSLLNNHVVASKAPYQTYQDEGKTVFIYNNSSATWVNGGIWYRVDGTASLTTDQLLRIANSF